MERGIYTFNNLTLEEIITLFKYTPFEKLQEKAASITLKNFGKKIWIRAVIEFSNYCSNNCLYCGIRAGNRNIFRYCLDEEKIISIAKKAIDFGIKTIVLQSGESKIYSSSDKLCRIIEKIKKINSEVAITLSCGYFTKEELRRLKNAGADRYLLRFEVADEKLYKFLKNGERLSKRIEMLINLHLFDFEVGSGFMVGLPGETDEIMAKNLLLCKQLNLDMVGIGPFIPHPDTPLKDAKLENFERTLRAVAILRLLLPYSNIPATTAMGTIDDSGREKAILSGANVIMPVITPNEVRKYYLLYPNKICVDENGFDFISCLSDRLKKIDREIVFTRGDSLNKCNFKLQKV